jgi:hypothetical protein
MPKPGSGGLKRSKAVTFLKNVAKETADICKAYPRNSSTVPGDLLCRVIPEAVRRARRDLAKQNGPK